MSYLLGEILLFIVAPLWVGNNEAEWVRLLDSHRVMKSEGQRVRESALVSSQQNKPEKAHSHIAENQTYCIFECVVPDMKRSERKIHSSLRPPFTPDFNINL